MQAGNAKYLLREDLPEVIGVFPLAGALLLPGAQLPLNIFEPRYLALFDAALSGGRLIGVIQPALDKPGPDRAAGGEQSQAPQALAGVGCIGRITSFAETGDGRYLATLTGVCRFRLLEEVAAGLGFRRFGFAPFIGDLVPEEDESGVDRAELLRVLRAFFEANRMEADWDGVERVGIRTLVNSLAMVSPFAPAEKQALLEAPDLKARAETLIAITEFRLARGSGETDTILQ